MSARWPGGIIRKTPVTPTGPYQDSAAPGVWSLNDAAYWRKQNLWPTQGRLSAWIGLLGSTGNEQVGDIAVGSSGAIYVVLQGSRSGNFEAYLVKYTPLGAVTWQVYIGGSGTDIAAGVAVDSSENIYVTATVNNGSNQDTLLVKYNSSGVVQWQRSLAGVSDEPAGGVALDSTGNPVIGSDGAFAPSYNKEAITAKYNSSGTVQWQRALSSVGAGVYNLALDSSDNVYVCGQDNRASSARGFVAKLNSSGVFQWSRAINSSSYYSDIAVSPAGNVYVAGYYLSGSYYQLEVQKLDTNGNNSWSRSVNRGAATFSVTASGIAIDSSENVYVIGTVDTSPYLLILLYNSSGTIQWQRRIAISGGASGGKIAISGDFMYITGLATSAGAGGQEVLVGKLPKDGSLTGTYGVWTYSSASYTETTGSTPSNNSMTSTSNTLTAGTPSYSTGTGALTSTVTLL